MRRGNGFQDPYLQTLTPNRDRRGKLSRLLRRRVLEINNSLRQNQFAVHALIHPETNLTVSRIQLIQALHHTTNAIGNPVIREITKQHCPVTSAQRWHIIRNSHWTPQDAVWLSSLQTRLPQILSVVVFELADCLCR